MTTTSDASGEPMVPLRSFFYVNAYKLYSLSSQLFSGFTSAVVQRRSETNATSESQKGPLASGQVLGDLASRTTGTEEQRFLFDYAYTLFERELIASGRVHKFEGNEEPSSRPLTDGSFVKVTGEAEFYDTAAIVKLLRGYPDLVKAFQALQPTNAEGGTAGPNRAQRRAAGAQTPALADPQVAKAQAFARVLELGMGDHLEVQVKAGAGPNFFSAILDADHLRERRDLLVNRFGRRPSAEITVVGVVARLGRATRPQETPTNITSIRDAVRQMLGFVDGVDVAIYGAADAEVVLDPIAVYWEL